MVNFEKFEEDMDPSLVERGREYWQNGAVVKLVPWREGQWHAHVQGSDLYSVKICRQRNKLKEALCSCPFDRDSICKHIIATLFAIRDGNESAGITSPPQEEKLIADYLETLSAQELQQLIKRAIAESNEFFNYIALQAQTSLGGGDKGEYVRIIRRSLASAQDRHGFIDWSSSRRAIQGADELLWRAQEIQKTKPAEAMNIYQAVLETLVPALQYADDSNGDIGGAIEEAAEGLDSLTSTITDLTLRQQLFDYLTSESLKKKYDGWDWCWSMLYTASKLVTVENRVQLFTSLDTLANREKINDFSDKYAQEQAAEIKLRVITNLDKKSDVETFMDDELVLPRIRERALQYYFDQKDYDKCEELATEGIKTTGQWPGLVITFTEWLHKIAIRRRDIKTLKDLELQLLILTGDLSYYKKLKKRFKESEWRKQRTSILKKAQIEKRLYGETLAELYRQEGMSAELLALVKTNTHLVHSHGKYLLPKYKETIVGIYRELVLKDMDYAGGRGMYQEKATLLRKMKKFGANREVEKIVNQFREKYQNRPALMEELDKVQ